MAPVPELYYALDCLCVFYGFSLVRHALFHLHRAWFLYSGVEQWSCAEAWDWHLYQNFLALIVYQPYMHT